MGILAERRGLFERSSVSGSLQATSPPTPPVATHPLDEYYREKGKAQEPYARRKLKFEVESWQSELRRLEVADRDFVSSSDDLDRFSTNEDLAAWLRRLGIGKGWLLGRYSRATNR